MACCPPGSLPALRTEYNAVGKVFKVGDLDVYQVGEKEGASSAIVVAYDIFGFEGQSRIRAICDQLASETGLPVYLPDYYRGGKWPADKDLNEQTMPELMTWLKTLPWNEKVKPDHEKVVAYLGEKGIKNYGMIGFCWGCWANFKAAVDAETHPTKMKCAVNCHPSVKLEGVFGSSEVELAKTLKCAQLLLPAGNDEANLKEGGDVVKALQNNEGIAGAPEDRVEVHVYPDMVHGFVTRGSLDDEKVARDVKDSLERAAAYFKKHLS
eukprot:CAMPEP_0201478302 /NCGR_PEP_ID=MMETSP0151_2-20130828/3190_1 /ASSEMBLY_ACC=CAM_ASM_000257 /TAXON_ID=200890 /ORGANISM="Paramoeba atlantica, Strain 621/1 / CCAP 1560/9" /LENGTH=266 /DNA_ID=CAMNT_0047859353 /DNA_START=54 /DNA_END=854 /DNA_ORIENTATION=-